MLKSIGSWRIPDPHSVNVSCVENPVLKIQRSPEVQIILSSVSQKLPKREQQSKASTRFVGERTHSEEPVTVCEVWFAVVRDSDPGVWTSRAPFCLGTQNL